VISKVWFNTIWLVAGKSERWEKPVNKAWLRTVHPPYYAGHGWALSLGKWSLRIGVCTPLYNDVNLDDEGDILVYSTMAKTIDTEPEEVGSWVSSEVRPNQSESVEQAPSEQQSELVVSAL
jgi:hypothetical protein